MTLEISSMMTKRIETIEGSASIQESAKKMKNKNVSSLVVVDDECKPQGLVTERDLVRKACVNNTRMSMISNKEIMSSPIISIDSTSSAAEAIDKMLQYNIRHLMVVDKNDTNKPVGMITPLDLRDEEFTDEGLIKAIRELSEYFR
jgi:CBS domain-containing protein